MGAGLPAFQEMLGEYMTSTQAMASAGVLVESGPLQPISNATTVRVRDGEAQLTDGPFAEIKKMLGGFYLLECADLDEAVRRAAAIPAASSRRCTAFPGRPPRTTSTSAATSSR